MKTYPYLGILTKQQMEWSLAREEEMARREEIFKEANRMWRMGNPQAAVRMYAQCYREIPDQLRKDFIHDTRPRIIWQ